MLIHPSYIIVVLTPDSGLDLTDKVIDCLQLFCSGLIAVYCFLLEIRPGWCFGFGGPWMPIIFTGGFHCFMRYWFYITEFIYAEFMGGLILLHSL